MPHNIHTEKLHANPSITNLSDDYLLNSGAVRTICGDISDMSLWRWLNNPTMNFPQPIQISRRNYWRRGDIRAWLASRREAK